MKFYVNGALNGENTSVSSPLLDIGDTLDSSKSMINKRLDLGYKIAKNTKIQE